ncbi:hypothetical protein [Rhodopila sp.]|uniref:hypothetical protein n=1 Tax=Rhodopila sp. TaxID=2480087 RepID=UPI003D153327
MWEFLNTAKAVRLVLVGGFLIVALIIILVWVEVSNKNITLWPPQITTPESDAVRACQIMQAALHDEIQSLDADRLSSFKSSDNDNDALNKLSNERLDAMERDEASKSGPTSYREDMVTKRIDQVASDKDYHDKVISYLRDRISDGEGNIYRTCSRILERSHQGQNRSAEAGDSRR